MKVNGGILKTVAKLLDSSDFDVAAGLREDEFNNFLTAHYKQQSVSGKPGGVYIGGGSLDDFGLLYTYSINASIVATIAPLTSARFKGLMQSLG